MANTTFKHPDRVMSLDLEMNQPSGTIIQIGAVVASIRTGEVLSRARIYVKTDEKINDQEPNNIVGLTGITDKHIREQGVDLVDAYHQVVHLHARYGCFINLVTWGGGDATTLKEQVRDKLWKEWVDAGCPGDKPQFRWPFGFREVDVKTIFIGHCLARGQGIRSGLAKSMVRVGLNFEGRKHDATDDSYNTFVLLRELLKPGGPTFVQSSQFYIPEF